MSELRDAVSWILREHGWDQPALTADRIIDLIQQDHLLVPKDKAYRVFLHGERCRSYGYGEVFADFDDCSEEIGCGWVLVVEADDE